MHTGTGVLSVTTLCTGAVVAVVGALGRRGLLPRNRWAGIRTSAAMRSDAAFDSANRAGGRLVLLGGGVALLGGVVALVLRAQRADSPARVSALVGLGMMVVLVVGGGIAGDRAARACTRSQGP